MIRKTPTLLAPVQRHRRSRATLTERVAFGLATGASLATVCKRRDMPRAWTVRRWLDEDDRFRARFEAARRAAMQAAADEVVALADAYAATAPAKKRSVAVRMQIEARKWWVRTVATELRDERRKADTGAKKAPAADKPSTHSIIVQRLREREAELKREAEARTAREAKQPSATTSDTRDTAQPIPTIVYGWPPSDAPGAPTENGSPTAPGAETPHRAAPASPAPNPAPQAPSRSPLVPDWFLEPREPPQPPYDPLDW